MSRDDEFVLRVLAGLALVALLAALSAHERCARLDKRASTLEAWQRADEDRCDARAEEDRRRLRALEDAARVSSRTP